MQEEPAAKAGVLAGDFIVSVNDIPIATWQDFTKIIMINADKPVKLVIKRNQQIKEIIFSPRAKESDEGEIVGFAGLITKMAKLPVEMLRQERLDPFEAFFAALYKTKETIFITVLVLKKMLFGQIGLQTLSGPITIAQGAGATVSVGFQYYIGYLALISISLGVLNLLPIPVLDGGHLLYYLIEIISRKPVSLRVQVVGFKIGMLLLVFLMTIAFYNDFVRLY